MIKKIEFHYNKKKDELLLLIMAAVCAAVAHSSTFPCRTTHPLHIANSAPCLTSKCAYSSTVATS